MEKVETTERTRQFAFIALGVLLLERTIITCLFVLGGSTSFLQGIPAIPVAGFLLSWIVPLAVIYGIE